MSVESIENNDSTVVEICGIISQKPPREACTSPYPRTQTRKTASTDFVNHVPRNYTSEE
jgi:hypothetical protein